MDHDPLLRTAYEVIDGWSKGWGIIGKHDLAIAIAAALREAAAQEREYWMRVFDLLAADSRENAHVARTVVKPEHGDPFYVGKLSGMEYLYEHAQERARAADAAGGE
jgi:hypothetical protein